MRVVVESRIEDTPRVEQVRGLFDLPPEKTSRVESEVALPLTEKPWHVGLVVGPSGCGKSTIARRLWEGPGSRWVDELPPWTAQGAVVDGFPLGLGIKDVTALLSSVGFSSPPA